jgi:hypothetical protein
MRSAGFHEHANNHAEETADFGHARSFNDPKQVVDSAGSAGNGGQGATASLAFLAFQAMWFL